MENRLKQIDDEITELKTMPIEGTPTEVYSRIVGYYRPVKNWNKGKSVEYKERVLFDIAPENVAPVRQNVDKWQETCQKQPTFGSHAHCIQFNHELTATRIA